MHDGSVNNGTQCEHSAGSKDEGSWMHCFSRMRIDPRRLILLVWLWLWPWSAWAQSGETIPIEELLAAPDRYHLHQVLVRGTVSHVRPFDPYQLNNGTICYAAYSFRLVDQTGALPVLVMGRCQIPLVKDPDVAEGDKVLVEVTIQQPGRDLFFMCRQWPCASGRSRPSHRRMRRPTCRPVRRCRRPAKVFFRRWSEDV